jgi:hypothetical protein
MKIIYATICALTWLVTASAQTNVQSSTALNSKTQSKQNKEVKQVVPTASQATEKPAGSDVIALKETEFDFGKIPQGKPVTHDFYFTNTGTTPLALQNVQASCGCTTPQWSKDSVAAGATSKITVGYNAANVGTFTKSITITYNDTQSKQIIIRGEVWKTPETSAPQNSASETLKNQ